MNRTLIEQGVRLIIEGMGVERDHNFADTPRRVADVYEELFSPHETKWPTFAEQFTDMVVMKGHVFYTLCPHHLLPVQLCASIAYIPNGHVIGASKLMRMCHDTNRYPMTQEALTSAIQRRIQTITEGTSKGEAVMLEGHHGCFNVRGVRSHSARMLTLKYGGIFNEQLELRQRFEWMVRV